LCSHGRRLGVCGLRIRCVLADDRRVADLNADIYRPGPGRFEYGVMEPHTPRPVGSACPRAWRRSRSWWLAPYTVSPVAHCAWMPASKTRSSIAAANSGLVSMPPMIGNPGLGAAVRVIDPCLGAIELSIYNVASILGGVGQKYPDLAILDSACRPGILPGHPSRG